MKEDSTILRIKSCMLIEWVCSNIYHLLAMNYPEEGEIWTRFAVDEETHAEIIAKGMEFGEPEHFAGFSVPKDLGVISTAVDYANEIKGMLVVSKIPMKEALEMMKRLLELKNEGYINDLIGKEKEKRIKKVFERLFEMDRSKLDIVETMITKYGS
jgi:hypothetical protein